MDLDFLHDWDTVSITFKVAVLMAVAAAYVLFELVLLLAEARRGRKVRRWVGNLELETRAISPVANLDRLGLEAYRPVSSWTRSPRD